MGDAVDRAQENEQRERDKAIFDALQNVTIEDDGTEYCVDCDELIPEARKLANPSATRCIACQEKFERGCQ